MGEFLKTLYVEHWLVFNVSQREWQWDLAQIKARNITDNIVELMTGKIQRLSAPTQVILKLAASVGNQFDLATLAVISETSVDYGFMGSLNGRFSGAVRGEIQICP